MYVDETLDNITSECQDDSVRLCESLPPSPHTLSDSVKLGGELFLYSSFTFPCWFELLPLPERSSPNTVNSQHFFFSFWPAFLEQLLCDNVLKTCVPC